MIRGRPRARLSCSILLLSLAAALGGCGDPTEDLERLPHDIASKLRAGELMEALEYLHSDFRGNGLDRAALTKILLYRQQFEPVMPYVADVRLDPAEEGLEERTIIVLGLLPKGDPVNARPRHLGPFRLEARTRLVGGDWLITHASLER